MLYHAFELTHAAMSPFRSFCQGQKYLASSIYSPLSYTPMGKSIAAACDIFESITKRYGKPEWDIPEIDVNGETVAVKDHTVYCKPFCNLIHFEKTSTHENSKKPLKKQPKVLLVAPLSGHYATLLRGTVKSMLPEHDVYITDWCDARQVPIVRGSFDLDDCIDYLIDFMELLGKDTTVIAVCQPSVPVLAAVARMAAEKSAHQPKAMVLISGPIDTRVNPTVVNDHARSKDISWFERNVISRVPMPHIGYMRPVYPGFLQLAGFMSMNMERHVEAHAEQFDNLVRGDGDEVAQHRKFYDEYLSVMDLPAEFFLNTVKSVFQDHDLAKNTLLHHGNIVDPKCIKKTVLMTIEGENDDICSVGQTAAAHDLCSSLPKAMKFNWVEPKVGHYGTFNGRRWRKNIQPFIAEMIRHLN